MKKIILFLICFVITITNVKAETLLYEGDVFIGTMALNVMNFHKEPAQGFELKIPSEIPGTMIMKGQIELKKSRWFFNRAESVVFNIKEVSFEGSEYYPIKARVIALNGVKFDDVYTKAESYKQAVKRNFNNAKIMASDFSFNPMEPIKSVREIDSVFQPVSWIMAAPAAVLSPVSAVVAKGDMVSIPKDTQFAIEILDDVIVEEPATKEF